MSRGRSHPRASADTAPSDPSRRRRRLVRNGVVAGVATALVIGAGVALSGARLAPSTNASASASDASARISHEIEAQRQARALQEARNQPVSRSADRTLVVRPVAHGRLWTTAPLDLRLAPQQGARTTGEIAGGKQVSVTGLRQHGFAQVLVSPTSTRWVSATYLSAKKPVARPGSKGLVDTPCAGTSGVENGLTSGAIRVYRAVCNNFPQITQYGGYAPRGEHASGKAIDVMTSDVRLGDEIAAFLQRNASALDLYDIIWRQHIWTPVRASEGWRSMPDRGSETANHYDHVHVSVN